MYNKSINFIKTNSIRLVYVFIVLFSVMFQSSCSKKVQVIYVEPNGTSSLSESSRDNPASLAEVVENLGKLTHDSEVQIILKDGKYYLDQKLNIVSTSVNNPLIIKAENEGEAILSGARVLNLNWTKRNKTIYSAKLEDVGSNKIDELYINGKYYRMSRFPDYKVDEKFFGGTSEEATLPEKVKDWADPRGGYMHALHEGLWGSKHYEITGVSDKNELIFTGGWQENRAGGWDPVYRGGYHTKYNFVENIYEELNKPGEWFINYNTREIYVIPFEEDDLSKALIEGTSEVQLLSLIGTEKNPIKNVTVEGIKFCNTSRVFMLPYERLLRGDWSISRTAAVFIEGAENVSVSDCYFENLGGNAVFVNNYCRSVNVEDNLFSDIGESAICFVGDVNAVRTPAISYENTLSMDEKDLTVGPKSNNYPKNCIAKGNLITRIGRIGKQVAGVFISQSEEITASHNTLYNIPRAAICINDGCWGGHIIEHNDAFNTVRESGDHGPFNSWGRDRFWETKHNGAAYEDTASYVKEQALLDCYKTIHIRNNRFSHKVDGHSWGIDLDDGSTNYYLYNNLCLGMGIKLREGFNRRVENNIIVNGFGGFHVWYPNCGDVIKNNIWVDDEPYQFIRANPDNAELIDYNLFYNPFGKIIITGVDDPMILQEWQDRGFDKNSLEADPMFVDPQNEDFTVKPESPAVKLGFKNFEMGNWGVTKTEFKEIVAQIERDYCYADDFERALGNNNENTKLATYKWMGLIVKNLQGKAEKSAAGLTEEAGVIVVHTSQRPEIENANLKKGAVILEMNGEKINNIEDLERFTKQYLGKEVVLKIMRGEIKVSKLVLSQKEGITK